MRNGTSIHQVRYGQAFPMPTEEGECITCVHIYEWRYYEGPKELFLSHRT